LADAPLFDSPAMPSDSLTLLERLLLPRQWSTPSDVFRALDARLSIWSASAAAGVAANQLPAFVRALATLSSPRTPIRPHAEKLGSCDEPGPPALQSRTDP
jgi:hypothetical protein